MYTLLHKERNFTVLIKNDKTEFVIDLKVLNFNEFKKEIIKGDSREEFAMIDSVGSESVVPLEHFSHLLKKYQLLWDNYDYFKEVRKQEIQKLVRDMKTLAQKLNSREDSEQVWSLKEEVSRLKNFNKNLKILYSEKENEILGLSRAMKVVDAQKCQKIEQLERQVAHQTAQQNQLIEEIESLTTKLHAALEKVNYLQTAALKIEAQDPSEGRANLENSSQTDRVENVSQSVQSCR